MPFFMKDCPRITIVTPCYNSERFLEETIRSVLDQGYPNLEYIIVDGGSTDGTLEIIRKYESQLSHWISEPDQGMYDAINKGFSLGTGEIFAWINSDDTYLSDALKVAANVFIEQPSVQWITGATVYTDESSVTVGEHPLLMYHQDDIRRGYHGLCMHYVQQNCCFWTSSLWRSVGSIPCDLKYAGDYWLWMQFAASAPLVSVNKRIASFRRHGIQLSNDTVKYRSEILRCYQGSKWKIWSRQILRRIARRLDLDVRLINWMRWRAAYVWIDYTSDCSLMKTRRTRKIL